LCIGLRAFAAALLGFLFLLLVLLFVSHVCKSSELKVAS
jgi:hypothetical protein